MGRACHRFGFEQGDHRGPHWINDVQEFWVGLS